MRLVQAACRNGNAVMTLPDELGEIYLDSAFADLFPRVGQPAQAPGRLGGVTILQFAEGLTDRQAADDVRRRIDWRCLLGLDLTDPGFDFSVLASSANAQSMGRWSIGCCMTCCPFKPKASKAPGTQRTDATHVVDAVRMLNRLELAGETLRRAVNDLALVVPDWLKAQVPLTGMSGTVHSLKR